MILYDPTLTISMMPYGILIPVRDSRATRTFAALSENNALTPTIDRWHCSKVTETLTRQDLLRVHAPGYVERLYGSGLEKEILSTYELIADDGSYHRYAPEQAERPLAELFQHILDKAAGTLQCARLALAEGFCFYFSGGMHHGHYDHGSGFCMINDLVIAVRRLQAEGLVKQAWVVDVDAHKGDGTAALTVGDDSIRTLSIHMAAGWPLDGPAILENGAANPAFIPSDIDIGISAGEEHLYLPRLRAGLDELATLGSPDLAVVVSGADPYVGDELPSTVGLRLSLEQMMARDQLVYRFLRARTIPAAYVMAGGYGEEVWQVWTQFLEWALSDIYAR
jgi:acetoin utilization deacetylase AcuC-like enzyme